MDESVVVWSNRFGRSERIRVNVVKSEYTFQPFRSEPPPRSEPICTVDLTKHLYDFLPKPPRRPRTPVVYMETIYYVPQDADPSASNAHKRLPLDNHNLENKKKKKKKKMKIDHHTEQPCSISSGVVDYDYEEEKTKTKTKKKACGLGVGRNNNKKKKVIDGPEPPPPMPQEMKDKIENDMHGSGLTLLLQRKLFESDLNSQQNRFSIPMAKLESTKFLSEEEREDAGKRGEKNRIVGLKVRLVDPKLDVYDVDFKRWDLATSSSFMITNKWSKVVSSNKFRKEHLIQLWFFRDQQNKPCFAIARIPPIT